MKALATLSLLLTAGLAAAQVQPVRIQIRHADPWLVKAMLEGLMVRSPEISSVIAIGGPNPITNGTGTPLIPNGTFMVNPADNSLWFIPNPPRRR
jgi:hypothetical protein